MSTIPKLNAVNKPPQIPIAAVPQTSTRSFKMEVPDSLSPSQETKTSKSFFQSLQDCFTQLWKWIADTLCFCFRKKEGSSEQAASKTEIKKNNSKDASETKVSAEETAEA